jgi:hypothetical protein
VPNARSRRVCTSHPSCQPPVGRDGEHDPVCFLRMPRRLCFALLASQGEESLAIPQLAAEERLIIYLVPQQLSQAGNFARRLALIEIDVLVAMVLGLTLEQLVDIYRIHFPVLKQNEEGTWYDQKGRIVWTCSKSLPGVGYLDERGNSSARAVWEAELAHMTSGVLSCKAKTDFLPGGPHIVTREFIAPFTKCDRIADYRRAWAHFETLGMNRKVAA